MAAAPITYRDQIWPASKTRFSSPQQTATEPSMTDTSTAAARWGARGTSPGSVGKGAGLSRSTGWPGLCTGVRHKGQKDAVSSSSTPQLTQYDIKGPPSGWR